MRYFMYAIFDSCSAVYDRPFVMVADGAAIRSFTDIAKDKEHPIGAHPEHYSLWRIGQYDDNKGVITSDKNECIARAHELAAIGTERYGTEIMPMGTNGDLPDAL